MSDSNRKDGRSQRLMVAVAVVLWTGGWASIFGQTDTEHVEETWTLKAVDGRWLISDSSIFSYGY